MLTRYQEVRQYSHQICAPLKTEDYVVQPVVDVSPPKWHLAHTTWFFETFVLKPFKKDYRVYHPDYSYVFNSYYEAVGDRVKRPDRGNLTRPTVEEIYGYRNYVDEQMRELLEGGDLSKELKDTIELGLQHEQQHQELLWTDIKYILGNNPLFPPYSKAAAESSAPARAEQLISFPEGIYEIGHDGEGFFFDNEKERHKVFLNAFSIRDPLVSNGEFLEFMNAGGYQNHAYWLSDAWAWVNEQGIQAPLYWYRINGKWQQYSYSGMAEVDPELPVCHVSYYEAAAFAAWKGMRLPTEAEWETASQRIRWGERWEWTESAYLPYPGFKTAGGAIGEYNGKFMINQQVLRGASVVTSPGHSRATYRNFFHPSLRWQFTGIRLAK